jgi:peptide deformylase
MLKLVTAPDKILKTVADDWQFQTETDRIEAARIESEMIAIMLAEQGRGLAANQVGLLKRVFVIHLEEQNTIAMFNPRILNTSEIMQIGDEGCLSFPNLWLEVKRPSSIDAEYFDTQGNKCIITLTGIDARCFCHELDHLNGVCFTDGLSPLKLAMAIKKQRKQQRKK